MWKCANCQNQNKDEYRFCLSCGEPRPQKPASVPRPAEDSAKKKESGGVPTAVLVFIAVVLVAAIVLVIVFFPRLSALNSASSQEEDTQETESRRSRRTENAAEASPASESGGTSTYVIGGDQPPESTATADITPDSVVTPEPTAIPVVTPSPSPSPSPVPAGEYLLPDSAVRYLTEDDLKGLTWEQCCLARNEIFARHGRIFVTPQIAAYFQGKDWYHGTVSAAAFDESVFNQFEKANISFISNYESSHWGGSYY